MSRYVTQDGASLHYEWYPAGPDRPVLVFLNGTGQCTRNWHQIRKLLAEEASVLLFDARGQGRTSPGRKPFSLAGHTRDAAELLQYLQITGANLVGVSHGGHVALALAGEYPHLVRALAVSGLGAEYGPRVRLILASWVRTLQGRGLTAWAREALPLVFGDAFLKSHEGRLDQIEAGLVQRNDSWSLLRLIQALLQYPHPRVHAEAARCPVTVLYGDDDPLVGAARAEELARICGGELRCFPGAGHSLTAEAPEDFAEALRVFFL